MEGGADESYDYDENDANDDIKETEDTPEIVEQKIDSVECVKDLGYSSCGIKIVIFYIFILSLLTNVDHGALPAALTDISNDLKIDVSTMGTLGSAVFGGLMIGSICASYIFNNCPYKSIIVMSFVVNGLSLWLFTATNEYFYMCVARFIAGFSQIFITIYIPLFIDVFATMRSKPTLLSITLIAAPIGVVAGYAMTSVIILKQGAWPTEKKYFWW